ncbi:hypothetical protein L1887_62329 [Cichorium endivia]|nr:hypothetical protein L1887_62329 [Cichorium endivia]
MLDGCFRGQAAVRRCSQHARSDCTAECVRSPERSSRKCRTRSRCPPPMSQVEGVQFVGLFGGAAYERVEYGRIVRYRSVDHLLPDRRIVRTIHHIDHDLNGCGVLRNASVHGPKRAADPGRLPLKLVCLLVLPPRFWARSLRSSQRLAKGEFKVRLGLRLDKSEISIRSDQAELNASVGLAEFTIDKRFKPTITRRFRRDEKENLDSFGKPDIESRALEVQRFVKTMKKNFKAGNQDRIRSAVGGSASREFFAIVEEVKSQRQLTKKQKQANRWSTKEEKNESNDHLRSLRKKVSEVKVRLAKAGDKKVKGQNAKYKFSNKQLRAAQRQRIPTNHQYGTKRMP